MGTAARPVIPDRCYMLTRRCTQRMFLLKPDKISTEGFVYCFAVAAELYDIEVHWLEVLSSHYHAGIRDQRGNYPAFLQYLHSLAARFINSQRGRWENMWASEQAGVLHLADSDAIFRKQIYGLTNPVKDHLVDRAIAWPGFSSLGYQLRDQPVVLRRPTAFFDRAGDMPEEVTLEFKRPPGFEKLSHAEWAKLISDAVALEEQKAAEQRRVKPIKLVGRKAIRRQSAFAQPKTIAERRGVVPRVATQNKWLRIELLSRSKQFVAAYREALAAWTAGAANVVFPCGTYQLARLHPIECAPPPAPS